MYWPPPDQHGLDATPAGQHQDGLLANPRRFGNFLQEGAFATYIRKRLPTPGVSNYAYSTLALVERSPIGRATAVKSPLRVIQPPQEYIGGQAVATGGIGGLAAGQIIQQPLIDPYNNTIGGVPMDGS